MDPISTFIKNKYTVPPLPKANFGQPSPGTTTTTHHHWKSHYPQEPKDHHIAKMRKTIKDFLEDGTRKTRGAPCEAAERR